MGKMQTEKFQGLGRHTGIPESIRCADMSMFSLANDRGDDNKWVSIPTSISLNGNLKLFIGIQKICNKTQYGAISRPLICDLD